MTPSSIDQAVRILEAATALAASSDRTVEEAIAAITATAAALDADRVRFDARDTDVYVPPADVYEALVNVAREVGPVRKDRTADAGKGGSYQFRGIDGVMNEVHGSMARNGVLPVPHDDPNPGGSGPQVREVEMSSRNGNAWRHHTITTRWVVLGPNGSSLEVPIVSEALDNQDKGLGKARSYGMKDLLIRLLTLPTDDPSADNEATVIPAADGPGRPGRARPQGQTSGRRRTEAPAAQAAPAVDVDADARSAGFEGEEHRQACHNEVTALRRRLPAEYRSTVRDEHALRYGKRWPLLAAELADFREFVEGTLEVADLDPTASPVAEPDQQTGDGLPAEPESDVDGQDTGS